MNLLNIIKTKGSSPIQITNFKENWIIVRCAPIQPHSYENLETRTEKHRRKNLTKQERRAFSHV